jgi:hypothetical protein
MNYISCTKWVTKTKISLLMFAEGWSRHARPFSVPMVWRELRGHTSDCYFRLTDVSGHTHTHKHKSYIEYPNLPSAFKPMAHGEDLPAPGRPGSERLQMDTPRPMALTGIYTHNITQSDIRPNTQNILHTNSRKIRPSLCPCTHITRTSN